jgi:hypothetical protein
VETLDGLPVIPRHVMAKGHEGAYRLAAFLEQPIIPHGHHQDCVDGFGLLEEITSINAIGRVTWMNMTAINRSSYLSKREGNFLKVKMLTRRAEVTVPEWATGIVVERPLISGITASLFRYGKTVRCATRDFSVARVQSFQA